MDINSRVPETEVSRATNSRYIWEVCVRVCERVPIGCVYVCVFLVTMPTVFPLSGDTCLLFLTHRREQHHCLFWIAGYLFHPMTPAKQDTDLSSLCFSPALRATMCFHPFKNNLLLRPDMDYKHRWSLGQWLSSLDGQCSAEKIPEGP